MILSYVRTVIMLEMMSDSGPMCSAGLNIVYIQVDAYFKAEVLLIHISMHQESGIAML